MVSGAVVNIFHLLALGQFSFALYYNYVFIAPLEMKVRGFEFGGPLVYLTILTSVSWKLEFNFDRTDFLISALLSKVVQVAYYVIALLTDFTRANGLRRLRDYVYGTFALPLAFETTLMFWAMTSIDRELVFPKALDAFFPRWLDVILHTNVSIFILLDMMLVRHIYPKRSTAVRGLTVFMLSYLIWLYVIFMNTGKWVYGIIGMFTAPQRIGFFVACGLVTLLLYWIGELLSKLSAGNDKTKKK